MSYRQALYKTTTAQFKTLLEKCRQSMKSFKDFKTFYPKQDDIIMMGNNINQYYDYIIFTIACNEPPKNMGEFASRRDMLNLIRLNTVFTDLPDGEFPAELSENSKPINPNAELESDMVTREAYDAALDQAYEETALYERCRIATKLLKTGDFTDRFILNVTKLTEEQLEACKADINKTKSGK